MSIEKRAMKVGASLLALSTLAACGTPITREEYYGNRPQPSLLPNEHAGENVPFENECMNQPTQALMLNCLNAYNDNAAPQAPTQQDKKNAVEKQQFKIIPSSSYVCVVDINADDYSFHVVSPDDEITHKTISGLDRDGVSPLISQSADTSITFTKKDDMYGYVFSAAIDPQKGYCLMDTENTGKIAYSIRDSWTNGKAVRRALNGIDAVTPNVKIPKIPGLN